MGRHARSDDEYAWSTVSGMQSNSQRITVTMPADQADQLKRLVDAGGADSVSSYVAEAVKARLDRDQGLADLRDLFDRKGTGPGAEHLAWARELLGVDEAGDPQGAMS